MAEVHAVHSAEEFDALAKANRFVVVDFTATWCPPCKAIAPIYANLAKKHGVANSLAFAKVDVDDLPDVTQRYGISAMPSFIVLENGEVASVKLTAPGNALGGGAVTNETGEVSLIRGADVKNLTLLAEKLNATVAPPAPAEEEEKKEETA